MPNFFPIPIPIKSPDSDTIPIPDSFNRFYKFAMSSKFRCLEIFYKLPINDTKKTSKYYLFA